MSPTRRPPRLDPAPVVRLPEPRTTAERLVRSRVAGRSSRLGPTELRRLASRLVAGDRVALGGFGSFDGLTQHEVSRVLRDVYGAWPDVPAIDADRTLDGAQRAAERVAAVAAAGGSVVCATSRPASLFALHARIAAAARRAGARVVDDDDSGELRVDGRRARRLRSLLGVMIVTDGASVLAVDGPEAPDEARFVLARPDLVVADGTFARGLAPAGLAVVALGGLELLPLAVAGARGAPVTVVPLEDTRHPSAYEPLAEVFEVALGGSG